MKEVTIHDIALVAKVSKATVSRVLNGTAAVSAEKKRAVLDATERLGFKPNVVAQSLASGRSMTIGVLTQLMGSPFYDTIAQGVISGLSGTGYSPIFADGQWDTTQGLDAIRALIGRRVDGLILIGGAMTPDEISSLCGDIPTVVVARNLAGDRHHCIYMDNVEGGYLATKHLTDRGHREIAIVQGVPHHPDAADRFEGYCKALREAGIALDPGLIIDGDFSAESGVRAIEDLYARDQSFTALFATNDMTAFGARLALFRKGVRVPEDVSLVGFDDQLESAFMTPPLTTVRQPAREMGAQASKAVLDQIDGKSLQSTPVHGQLQVRESVGRRQQMGEQSVD